MLTNEVSNYRIRVRRKKLVDSLLFFHHRRIDKALRDLAKRYNSPTCKVIEVGAGTKALAHKRLFNKAYFIATDIEKYDGIDDVVDITSPRSLASDFFDLIICTNVLEHIPDPHRAVNEMHRALKRGGELFLVTPFLFPIHDPPHDFYRYTEYALIEMLKEFSRVSIQKIHLFSRYGLFDRLILYYITQAVK